MATTTRAYNNPEYDKLIEQAGALPLEEALPLYNQAQEILVEDAPAVFTRWRTTNYENPPVGLRRPRDGAGLRELRRPVPRDHRDPEALSADLIPHSARGWAGLPAHPLDYHHDDRGLAHDARSG